MREEAQALGVLLRQVRQDKGLTLEELSEKSGVSASLLSQLERGAGNPSYFTLQKLAAGIGVPLSRFFQGLVPTTEPVVRKDKRRKLVFQDRGLVYELLTPDLDRQLEFVWCEMPPGFCSEQQPLRHKGEECVFLLKGTVEVNTGSEKYVLEAGDSIWLQCEIPHWYRNLGEGVAICITAITPPAF